MPDKKVKDEAVIQNADAAFSGNSSAVQILSGGGLNVNSLRTNATLRKEEWLELDTTVVDIARQRLNGIADLQNAGLVRQLGGLGTTETQYETISDMSDADVDMDAETAGEEDRVTYTLNTVPVPIIHKNFRINIRTLDASRRLGQSLDVTQTAVATRKVTDKLESILFSGESTIVANGNTIYGYTNHGDRNTASASGDWGTIANIYTDCNTMLQAAETDYFWGPFTMYVAATQFGQMRAIYTDGSGESAYERVLRGLPQITAIKPSDVLTAGSAVLVQLTRDVVELAVGLDITPIEWETRGGMSSHFKVMTAMVPILKADDEGKMGLVHMTGL
jgi:uncharacterized linocin/CFP29 family protein